MTFNMSWFNNIYIVYRQGPPAIQIVANQAQNPLWDMLNPNHTTTPIVIPVLKFTQTPNSLKPQLTHTPKPT